jgi:hypothetical protein
VQLRRPAQPGHPGQDGLAGACRQTARSRQAVRPKS